MTTVLFIHSAGPQSAGEGSSRLVDGLRSAIAAEINLSTPLMPRPDSPKAEPWIDACQEAIAATGDELILLGHSLGGSVILQTLARHGVPPKLLGVVLIATPFWGASGWDFDEFALPPDAGTKLAGLKRLIILRGDADDVVAADHPTLYKKLLPIAETETLTGVDHEAAHAAPRLLAAIEAIRQSAM